MPSLGAGPALSRDDMGAVTFLEHLEELRKRIIWSIIWIGAGFCVCWWKADLIYGYMKRPIDAALTAHKLPTDLVYLNPTEPFNMYLKIGLLAGVFGWSPSVLSTVGAFIAPGR